MTHRHERKELTESEIVPHEIDPVLFIHLLTTDNFLFSCYLMLNGRLGYYYVPYAVNDQLIKLVFSLSSILHQFRSLCNAKSHFNLWMNN